MATLIKITRTGFASIRRRYRWYEVDGVVYNQAKAPAALKRPGL